MLRWILTGVLAVSAAGKATAQEPIVELKVVAGKSVFAKSAWNRPIEIKSAEDAAKHFDAKALKVLAGKVDFKKQFVLVFAWRGSGQDKLNYAVAESFPEQIFFSLKRGLTRDLRPHVRVFALRSNVKWSVRAKNN